MSTKLPSGSAPATRNLEDLIDKLVGEVAPIRETTVKAITLDVPDAKATATLTSYLDSAPNDLRRIGGDSDKPAGSQVEKWVGESLAPLVILSDGKPAGFISVQPFRHSNGRESMELGRLIILPEARRKALGSSVTCFVDYRVHHYLDQKNDGDTELVMRVLQDNDPALKLVDKIQLKRVTDPALNFDNFHFWFASRVRKHRGLIGGLLEELRRNKGLSYTDLGRRVALSEAFIRQVENGTRSISRDKLRIMANVLAGSEIEFVRIAMAYLDEPLPPNVLALSSLRSNADDRNQDLWVASDQFAELMDESFLKMSQQALEKGFERIYLIPGGADSSVAASLVSGLKAHSRSIERGFSTSNFKIFQVPESICSLRAAFHAPSLFSVSQVTVEGPNQSRVPLGQEAGNRLFSLVRVGLLEAERQVSESTEYKLIYSNGWRVEK
ncbi:GNAT family N-acetyltransferase [Hyphomonas sp.]|uniref:GNAT family N-acetyltransferase n=1 Tax=Hyphomonas sp. TaxID=87 RepID=UPI0025BFFD66|nr:GNAT family N-acetyltransferase [Hyphomonas sp.]